MSLSTNIGNLTTRIATEVKALRTLINGNVADLSALTTTQKGNLVAAINEVAAAVGSAGASIDDEQISTLTVWSSDKTDDEIDSRVSEAITALINDAPEALDTLKEIADKLGDNDDAIAALVSSIAGKADDNAVVKLAGSQTITGAKTFSVQPVGIVKASVGLDNVDNTSDVNKPVSTAQQTALNLKIDATSIGDPETNFVTVFEAGLA